MGLLRSSTKNSLTKRFVAQKKLQCEGVFCEMKLKQNLEKPSKKKARNKAEAIRSVCILVRKKLALSKKKTPAK